MKARTLLAPLGGAHLVLDALDVAAAEALHLTAELKVAANPGVVQESNQNQNKSTAHGQQIKQEPGG
jgi:hypothetical protein